MLVKRRLKPRERKPLLQITRGLPHLCKLREIMEHLDALFEQRCRTQTALDKLNKLRQWVKRFKWIGDTLKKVFAPTLDQALTCLDDKLLPATSNAVERGNRRHRKMQKSVYRVRSQVSLEERIALDMIRESRAENRAQPPRCYIRHAGVRHDSEALLQCPYLNDLSKTFRSWRWCGHARGGIGGQCPRSVV